MNYTEMVLALGDILIGAIDRFGAEHDGLTTSVVVAALLTVAYSTAISTVRAQDGMAAKEEKGEAQP
ncbi:MAG: hypothetical protein WC565_07560 [Parcubacteria group bacterium]